MGHDANGESSPLVVRYRPQERAAAEATLRDLVRKQGMLLAVLGVLLGLLVAVPFVAAAKEGVDAPFLLGAAALMAVPVALVALGARQLRRRPRLPEVAVTITATTVELPAIERPGALARRLPAVEWSRATTSAMLVPATTAHPARVELSCEGGRERRTINAASIDVSADTIVEALARH